ncbi:MAG: zinc-binding dehydrogenase, partial [Acidimicrobiales bacterium]|nr:zinc-binding dehydrogenase [Acidimicrobiales bacterium]
YRALSDELTSGSGFDDIVVLDPSSGDAIEEIAKLIAFRGTMNMVGSRELDRFPLIDVGRLHYHYTAYIGTNGPEISASYGEARNRADFVPGGVAVFVGAGGPMGQMHMQRAIETEAGPGTILGFDLDDDRLEVANKLLADLAAEKGKEFILVNPETQGETAEAVVERITDGAGADDVVVSVPVGAVMGDAAELMGPNGMLVLFAGVPNGTMAPLNISNVYLHNAQYTGTSGSSIADQAMVLDKAVAGSLSPERSLAAIGGIEAGQAGIQAMIDGDYAGKIMIFPQLTGLPLTGLDNLADVAPEVAERLGEGNLWTREAEDKLLELFAAKE